MKHKLIFSLFLSLISCNNHQKPFEKNINTVFGEPLFRNIHIGDSYNKVLKTEKTSFVQFTDTNIIKCMYHLTDSEEYQWSYVFEDDKVKQIHFDAYLGEIKDGEKYLNLIQKKYNKILGPPSFKEGLLTWKKDDLMVTLRDESTVALMGKVRLLFFNAKDSLFFNSNPIWAE